MHTQLRNPTVNRPNACCSTQHGSHGTTTTAIVADLEDLQLGVDLAGTDVSVDTALEDGSGDGVGSHMGVRVCGDGGANVEAGRVVLEVGVEEIWVDGVDDVGGDKERVCVGAGDEGADGGGGEGVDDALNNGGEEVAVGTLAEERTDLFVVEEGDELDLRGGGGRGVEEGLNRGPGAELVVDTACEDELFAETAELSGLDVEELEFPVDYARVCLLLARVVWIVWDVLQSLIPSSSLIALTSLSG
jgi:hypothetical protein